MKEKKFYTSGELAKLIGVSKSWVDDAIILGKLDTVEGLISADIVNVVIDQRMRYISLYEYCCSHQKEGINFDLVKNRNALKDYILNPNNEIHISLVSPDWMIVAGAKERVIGDFFFLREEVEYLNQRTEKFFSDHSKTIKKETNKGLQSVFSAAKALRISQNLLLESIEKAGEKATNGFFSKILFEKMKKQRQEYISFYDFCCLHRGDDFNPEKSRHRDKLEWFIKTKANISEIGIINAQNVFITNYREKNSFFIKRDQIEQLNLLTSDFFEDFKTEKKIKDEKGVPVYRIVKEMGFSRQDIEIAVSKGKIQVTKGMISQSIYANIKKQREEYISSYEYGCCHKSERFNPEYIKCRKDLDEYIIATENGIEIEKIYGVDILVIKRKEEESVFFKREKIGYLEEATKDFFKFYGMSEREKINVIIKENAGDKLKEDYLAEKIKQLLRAGGITGSVTHFVKLIMEAPAIERITDEDVAEMLASAYTLRTKELLDGFFRDIRKKADVHFHNYEMDEDDKDTEVEKVTAYPMDFFSKFAFCLFNENEIKKNNMVEKALHNHVFGEAWLFLSLLYVCGWRSNDICSTWQYLYLDENDRAGVFGLCREKLYEDILADRIEEKVYAHVCDYVLDKIGMMDAVPSKTENYNPSTLKMQILPGLRPFFGRLILIAESNQHRFGHGYITANRIGRYRLWVTIKDFLGEDAFNLVGRYNNIKSTRMNKTYLQTMVRTGFKLGETPMTACYIAMRSRNHNSVNTTGKWYIAEEGSAEEALEASFERGIFGFAGYRLLETLLPQGFRNLPASNQTEFIKQINLVPYEMEQSIARCLNSIEIMEEFQNGEYSRADIVLQAMMEVSMGRGKAKDKGIFCFLRSLDLGCEYWHSESCIAENCEHCIYTRDGLEALLEVMNDYMKEADNGDVKSEEILKQDLIPHFKDIISAQLKEMSVQERKVIEKKIRRVLGSGQ